jgi:Flp pilus assembly protein TadD
MSKPFRFASAASVIALASMVAACAVPQGHLASASGQAKGEKGLATRALLALNANDPATAIDFAERAVEQTADNATLRTLLGNAYFAGGRFASAETAYKDSLALQTNQPQIILKVALVQIAQGKTAEALAFLDAGRNMLPAADYGLALALAGRAVDAVRVLEVAARMPGADARLRQNLALAYAFTGDWAQARTIAAQDIPAGALDARIQQWMQLAKPAKVYDQVAALTGVTPAASDAGQPVRLALRSPDTQLAAAPAVAAPAPPAQPQAAEDAPQAFAPVDQAKAELQPEFAASISAPNLVAVPVAVPAAEVAPPPAPPPPPPAVTVAAAAAMAPEAPAIFAALAPKVSAPKLQRASAPAKRAPARNAALRRGSSTTVVQLGAYRSPTYVAAAWKTLTKRYPALREYLPMRARFDSPKGTYWRLSIQGFESQREAIARCDQLKSNGGACFVRNVAGDAPVQFASR